MPTIKSQFSGNFPYDEFLVITGTTGPTRFPNIDCGLARFKAHASNVGIFTFGSTSGTTANLPWQMKADNDTGWFAVGGNNLNTYWYKDASGTMDRITVWLQK